MISLWYMVARDFMDYEDDVTPEALATVRERVRPKVQGRTWKPLEVPDRPETLPSRGLIVRKPWIGPLLVGRKTWELRGSKTTHRGRTGLIESGTGRVIGEADLVDVVGPLDLERLAAEEQRHMVAMSSFEGKTPYPRTYAWVFENPVRYPKSVEYRHPHGAVIWVDLDKAVP